MTSQANALVGKKKRPDDLPDFERPPLVEVVLGVQFSELCGYRTFHGGLLWHSKFRNEFPICMEQPPIEPAFETFGSGIPTRPHFQVQLTDSPPPPRLWFVNNEQTELVQIQADRFLHNWRRMQDHTEYPRYEPIRDRFFAELTSLVSFLENEKIGSLEPNQCEVTYVNHIDLGGEVDPRTHFHRIFAFWSDFIDGPDQDMVKHSEIEDVRFNARFAVVDPQSGEPRGRLHIDAQPAIGSDEKAIIRLNLTARGSPLSPSFGGVADFLDIGREALVRRFTAITSAEMHETWKRTK